MAEGESRWTIANYIAVISAGIAVVACCVTFYGIHLQRDAIKRQSHPYMLISLWHGELPEGKIALFRLLNLGVGPAYLQWFQVLVDNQPQANWRMMTDTLSGEKDLPFNFTHPPPVWQASGQVDVYIVHEQQRMYEILRKNVTRIGFRFCYCSIFEKCWLGTLGYEPTPRATCDPPPQVYIGGKLPTRSEW